MNDDAIPRISNPSREEFYENYVRKNRPVIITDVVSRWPISTRWTVEYVRRHFDPNETWVCESSLHRNPTTKPFSVSSASFFERLNEPDLEVDYYSADQMPDSLRKELDACANPYLHAGENVTVALLIGRNTKTQLHYHPTSEAIFCEILGTKTFYMLPPQTRNMYYVPWSKPDFQHSRVDDPLDPGPEFPKFPRRWLRCEVKQGEMLYVPIHWWHVVYGKPEPNIAFTTFWFDAGKPVLLRPADKLRHLLTLAVHRTNFIMKSLKRLHGRD